MTLICSTCGAQFEAKRKDAKRCSGKCRVRACRSRRTTETMSHSAREPRQNLDKKCQ